jgi:hypothetical protein
MRARGVGGGGAKGYPPSKRPFTAFRNSGIIVSLIVSEIVLKWFLNLYSCMNFLIIFLL